MKQDKIGTIFAVKPVDIERIMNEKKKNKEGK